MVAFIVAFRAPPIGDFGLDTDFYGDLVVAAQALTGGHFSVDNYPYKGPLYSFVLSAVQLITSDWYRAATLVSAGSAFVALMGIYRLVARVFSPRAALATVVGASLVQEFFVHSHHATTDQLFLALAVWSCVLYFGTSSLWRRRGLAGALAGFAFLRPYGVTGSRS
jgi:4-amino-4-deoxy-L-arabinose transferase-like glycosyltransferase